MATKEKLGRKDIFAPAPATEAEVKTPEKAQERGGRARRPAEGPVIENAMAEAPRTVTHSFRMREDLVEKLREYAFFEKTKIYKVVNQALEEFLKGYKPGNHARLP